MITVRRRNRLQLTAWVSCVMLFFTGGAIAQNGEVIFRANCASCHRVGGGRLVGPDLMGITNQRSEEWLLKWTKSSQTFIKSGDKDAQAIYNEFNHTIMPDMGHLPESDLKAIFAYIASKSSSATAVASTEKKEIIPDASSHASQEVIAEGENIFMGKHALSGGGPACISCHNVDYKGVIPGGLLAKDLTTVYERMGGDAGIQGILGAPPFPAMAQAYKNKPLTEKEMAAITAFFNKVSKDKANQQVATMNPLLYGGSVGTSVLLIFIFLIWRKRKKYTVKKSIYDRQIKSI